MEENSKGSWHNWEISRDKQVDDAAIYVRARDFAQSIDSGDVVVKHHNDDGQEKSDEVPF